MTGGPMSSHIEEGRQNSLRYQAEMLAELEAMARAEGFDSLAYLIGMARDEAAELLHTPRVRDAGRQGGGKPDTAPPG